MEVTLKRLTRNGTFANEVVFLTQQKTYSFGRISGNDVVLFAPTIAKKHCIFHHNSKGLFVEVLESLEGVVVNGKKYSTGSMVRLHNKDLVAIGLLFKYEVGIKPIVQDIDAETNLTSHSETDCKIIKEENLSKMTANIEPELNDATGGIQNNDYEEILTLIRRDESLSEAPMEIREEHTLEEETHAINLDEIDSSMQITIDEEDVKPLLPLNLTGEASADPKTIIEISKNPETLKLSGFSSFAREKTHLRRSRRMNKEILQKSSKESFKKKVSDKPKQNIISLIESEISDDQVSENLNESDDQVPENRNESEDQVSKNPNESEDQVSKNPNESEDQVSKNPNESEDQVSKNPNESEDQVSKNPNESEDQVSKNPNEIEEQSKKFKENNIISNKESEIIPKRISVGISRENNKIFLQHLSIGNPKNAMKILQTNFEKKLSSKSSKGFKTHSVEKLRNNSARKLRNNSVRKLRNNSVRKHRNNSVRKLRNNSLTKLLIKSPSPEKKLEIKSVKQLQTNIVHQLEIDSVKNPHTKSSLETIPEIKETEQLPPRKQPEPSKRKIPEEIKKCSPSSKKVKSGQEAEKRLPEKRLFVTLIDIMKNPISNFPSMKKRPPESENFKKKSKPARKVEISHNEKLFICKFCDKKLSSNDYLKIHEQIHILKRPHKCEKCGTNFDSNSQLQDHLETCVEEIFTCDHCGKTFNSKRAVARHLNLLTGSRRKTCGICQKTVAHKSALRSHMKTHTYNGKFKCKECSELFDGENDLVNHIKIHTDPKKYKCSQCDKSYNCKSALNIHLRTNHTRRGLYKCNVCDKRILAKTVFEEHLRIHTGERPFVCEVCDKSFRGKFHLWSHMRSHAVRFTCNECEETFANKTNLERHLRIHFPNEGHSCQDCDFVAKHPASLMYHRRKHTGEKPFKCRVCKEAFSLKNTLKSHMMLHTGDYPHRCRKCNKGFPKLSQLKMHYATHDKKGPFICAVCFLEFSSPVRLKRHYPTHKSNERKCETCHLQCARKPQFDKHCRKHLEIPGEFNCMVCKKEFKSQKDLIAHCWKTLDLLGKCSPDN